MVVGQSCTHQELLRGILNGAALVACDLTSPDATTLVRQYQSAVFTPIMRVHMMQVSASFNSFYLPRTAPRSPKQLTVNTPATLGRKKLQFLLL